MTEVEEMLCQLLEGRRRLAKAMLDGFAADAFEKKPGPEDVAASQAGLEDCERQLAELRGAQDIQGLASEAAISPA